MEKRKRWRWRQGKGTLTLRMFVTVGSARRISPGLGWMLAFSPDFSCGACSRSAALWPEAIRQEKGKEIEISSRCAP